MSAKDQKLKEKDYSDDHRQGSSNELTGIPAFS